MKRSKLATAHKNNLTGVPALIHTLGRTTPPRRCRRWNSPEARRGRSAERSGSAQRTGHRGRQSRPCARACSQTTMSHDRCLHRRNTCPRHSATRYPESSRVDGISPERRAVKNESPEPNLMGIEETKNKKLKPNLNGDGTGAVCSQTLRGTNSNASRERQPLG